MIDTKLSKLYKKDFDQFVKKSCQQTLNKYNLI